MVRFIFSFLLLLFTRQVFACASCGFNDESNSYFLLMILFMTTLPVLMVGTVIYFIRRNGRRKDP